MRVGRVYKNVNESNIIYIYHNIKFYISSDFNYERMRKLNEYVENELQKIKNKYGQEMLQDIKFSIEEYLAICYYLKIEKRGKKYERIKK